MGAEVEGAHVGAAPAQRGDQRDPVLEGPVAEDLRERMLDGPVAAVDRQQLDVLARQLRQRLGDGQGARRLHGDDVGVTLQEAQQPGYPVGAASRTQVVQ